MDALDRALVNRLQDGLRVCERPFAEAARALGCDEATVIARLEALLADGTLSRFGPLYDAERLGGAVTLAAMAVPDDRFDEVAALVNAYPEVAQNYARDHRLNMWFVIAACPERIGEVIAEIEAATGLAVLNLPKEDELFLGVRLEA